MARERVIYHVPFRTEKRESGWFLVVKLGAIEYAFLYGSDEPKIAAGTPMIDVVLQFPTVDGEPIA